MLTTDADLLRRYIVGRSEAAFCELVRRHVDLVYSSALRRVGNDAHLAEDVTQQVFVELARQGRKLLSRQMLEGWLYTTSRFKAVDLVRSERRRRARELASVPVNGETPDSDRGQDWKQVGPLLESAMDSLSSRDREVLLLRYFRSKSFAEVGQRLALTEDAARKRSERAIERLRVAFAKRGVDSTAEALGLVIADQALGMPPAALITSVTNTALFSAQAAKGAGLLHLLTTTKVAAAAGTLALLLASVATAVSEVQERVHASEALALSLKATAEAQKRLSEITKLDQASEKQAAALRQEMAAVASRKRGVQSRTGAHAMTAAEAGRQFSSQHPEMESLAAARARANIERGYGPLLRSLQLGPDQVSQFSNLFVQGAQGDILWHTALDFDHPTVETVAGVEELSKAELAQKMQELLGAAGYQQYQNYRTNGVQQVVQQLAGSLYSTDTPITETQGEQLVQILAQSYSGYQSGGKIPAAGQINWNTAMANATGVLSGPQIAALEDLRQNTVFDGAVSAAANQAARQALASAEEALSATPK